MLLEICLVAGIFIAISDYFSTIYKMESADEEVFPLQRKLLHRYGLKKGIVIGNVGLVFLFFAGYVIGVLLPFDYVLLPMVIVGVMVQLSNFALDLRLRKRYRHES